MLLFFRTPQNVPLEVWLKLIALSLGIIGGWWVAPNIPFHNAEHIMIFVFFLFHPIMELLYYFKIEYLPPKLDYLGIILAYSVEGFLILKHLHGRTDIDVQMHTYLFYSILGCALASTFEMVWIHDVRPAVARAAFSLLQGTWMVQVNLLNIYELISICA
jgi:hypothetical protein